VTLGHKNAIAGINRNIEFWINQGFIAIYLRCFAAKPGDVNLPPFAKITETACSRNGLQHG